MAAIAGCAVLLGCGEPEELLPGPRFDLRDPAFADADITQTVLPEQPARRVALRGYAVTGEARPLSLPAQRTNTSWTETNGGPQHWLPHPALGANLTQVWSVPVGQTFGKRIRMTADPVIGGGRIFVLDAHAQLRALAPNGGLLWQRNLTPPTERTGEAAAGGLTYANGRIYVTTGYGVLHVLDATSGGTIWTQNLQAVPTAGPTVSDGLVYVTGRDGRGWALDAADGRISWQIDAGDPGSVFNTGASPAIAGRAVLFPFGTTELLAALRRGGVTLWSTNVSGERLGSAYAGITDVTGDPVVVGNTVYVANPSGRVMAVNATSGERIWTAERGAYSAVWPAGGSLFLISDQNELVRLDAATGEIIWEATLPLYTRERVQRRFGIFAHYGPVLAGGRLIVVSSDRLMREIDPTNGRIIRTTQLSAPAVRNPVVANGTLYVVTADGRLHAFR
ncbi:MAG: PQQ-binding-like beta-propeller repeat protein [Pseudomonadota bacterium]